MAQANEQHVFFVDDELVERLMRGDGPLAAGKKSRPAATTALGKAVELAEAGRLDEAIAELEGAASRGGDPIEIHTAMGHVRFEQQQWEQAAACYAKVTALNAKHPTAHYNLALALERQEKFDEAATEFEAAHSAHLDLWQAHVGRGLCLLQAGQNEPALESFHHALRQQPDHDRALFGKAVALHTLGRLDEAGEIYRKLLPGNASSEELLMNLIALAAARHEDQKIREYSERLLKIHPQCRAALESLSALALARGDYNAAVQHGSLLTKVAADSYEAWFNLGLAYHKVGRLDLAGNAYQEAARVRPEKAEAHANLSAVLAEQGDWASSCAASKAALAVDSQLPGALWNLAIAAEKAGQPEDAENHLTKLVKIQPEWEDAAFRLGFLQLQRGEFAGAVDSFELALKHRPDWMEALLNLGLACWKFEDLDTAATTFDHVIELQPQNPDALRALVAIAIERKEHERAWELHKRFVATGERSLELAYNLGLLLQAASEPGLAAECYRQAL